MRSERCYGGAATGVSTQSYISDTTESPQNRTKIVLGRDFASTVDAPCWLHLAAHPRGGGDARCGVGGRGFGSSIPSQVAVLALSCRRPHAHHHGRFAVAVAVVAVWVTELWVWPMMVASAAVVVSVAVTPNYKNPCQFLHLGSPFRAFRAEPHARFNQCPGQETLADQRDEPPMIRVGVGHSTPSEVAVWLVCVIPVAVMNFTVTELAVCRRACRAVPLWVRDRADADGASEAVVRGLGRRCGKSPPEGDRLAGRCVRLDLRIYPWGGRGFFAKIGVNFAKFRVDTRKGGAVPRWGVDLPLYAFNKVMSMQPGYARYW